MRTETNGKIIDDILGRSIANILPSKEEFKKSLMGGTRLRFYMGADPTGPDLHIGHATNFIVLEKMRQLGHEVVILFGDFTAMIGDPSDKEAVRKRLSEEEVKKNIKTWKKQVGKVLNLTDTANPVKIMRNSAWLKKLSFKQLISLSAHFTVQQMIERDMFQKRLHDRRPIYLHEFFYPLMQGYDSVAMDVDVEIGGTDQTFNMLMGRTLQKIYHGKEKFVLATPLLEDPNTGGKLMSKSEGRYIALSLTPEEMFGKAMALPDGVIYSIFRDCTLVGGEYLTQVEKDLQSGKNPRDLKYALAYELVKTYHNESAAEKARKSFTAAFKNKEMPDYAPEVVVPAGKSLAELLVEEGIVTSKSELRRLIEGGGVFDLKTEKRFDDMSYSIGENLDLRIGKKRFLKIRVR